MSQSAEPKRHVVKSESLPPDFPTHAHSGKFWEELGRTVATFGFLEETLGKAIFAFTGMRSIPEDQVDAELEKWIVTLEKALADPLGALIGSYSKAIREHGGATISNLSDLEGDLREASKIRNVICHGSWRSPDDQGRSLPFFVNNRKEVFQTPIDIAYLNQVRRHVVDLICAVINSVTHMGWQFPGSSSPGVVIAQPR